MASKAQMKSVKAKAPTQEGRVISQSHHLDSVVYNEAHAMRHIQEAEKHAAKLEPGARRQAGVKTELKKLAAMKKKVLSTEMKGSSKAKKDSDSG